MHAISVSIPLAFAIVVFAICNAQESLAARWRAAGPPIVENMRRRVGNIPPMPHSRPIVSKSASLTRASTYDYNIRGYSGDRCGSRGLHHAGVHA